MRREIIFICLIVFCFIAQAQAAVRINEIMVNPDAVSDTNGEWFELYNDGDEDVDINNWVIKDTDTNFHQIDNFGALFIYAKSFLVLGRNADSNVNGGYFPDYVYSGFILANTEDEIILENSTVVVDEVHYANSWPITAAHAIAYIGCGDNNNVSNWISVINNTYGDGDYGTPGSTNVIPEPTTLALFGMGVISILFAGKVKSKNGRV